jgi:hypothetical protein
MPPGTMGWTSSSRLVLRRVVVDLERGGGGVPQPGRRPVADHSTLAVAVSMNARPAGDR